MVVTALVLVGNAARGAQSSSCLGTAEAEVRQLVKDFDAAATTHDPENMRSCSRKTWTGKTPAVTIGRGERKFKMAGAAQRR